MWHCPWNDVELPKSSLGLVGLLMDLFMLNVLTYSLAQSFKPDPFPQMPSKLKQLLT